MDRRSRREKLLAMAMQSDSPREAEVALRKLGDVVVPRRADDTTHRTLSRAEIMATPDLRAPRPPRRVYDPSLRVTVVLDADDDAFADVRDAFVDWSGY